MVKMLLFDLKTSELEFLKNIDTSDFELTLYKESLTPETKLTVKECDETAILSVFSTSKVTYEVLEKFKNLRVITTRSINYNHIDIEECRRRNIAVINSENFGKNAVSQYVIGLVFNLTRNINISSIDIKNERYDFEKYEGEDIDKLSIGVVGTGSIGSAVCELANKIGMKVYANDIVMNKTISEYTQYVSLNDLLRKSDIVTLHIPYIKEFYHLISEKELVLMKDNGYLINTSNPNLVSPIALYKALSQRKLKGCALDIIPFDTIDIFDKNYNVLDCEEMKQMIVWHKLLRMENVIITPKIAYNTRETLNKILNTNFHNIKDFYIGRKTNRVV